MSKSNLKIFFASVAILVFATYTFVSPVAGSDSETSFSVIKAAEDSMMSAYEAVLEAEKAGGNVSGLLVRLNEAGMLLSRAKLAYGEGDFDSAVYFADQSLAELDGFVAEADGLRRSAEQSGYWDFLVNFVGSGVGALGVLVVGFVVWVVLKRREEAEGRV